MDYLTKPLLKWFDQYGRHDLPWQHPIEPYRVWLSEIMLQQTQVVTVIPYFNRFIDTFPTVQALANAELDQVLHLWSGLGYYARGRNLHKAAQKIRDDYAGIFPSNFDDLLELPGVGRSTAGAIASIAFGQRKAILDGNVKRVLSRYEAISASSETTLSQKLWEVAEAHTPEQRVGDYTQAIMDLGATICTRTQPKCSLCPLQNNCKAFVLNTVTQFPQKKQKKIVPTRETTLLILRHNEEALLQKRPATGIWGGLWSFPEIPELDIPDWCEHQGFTIRKQSKLSSFRHSFSHYHLQIAPILIDIAKPSYKIMEADQFIWYNCDEPDAKGLSAVVTKLLGNLCHV